jgi:hypothetical protein
MKHPSEIAVELLEAFDARYTADRQALVDTLVTLGLLVVEDEDGEEEEPVQHPWVTPFKQPVVLDADMADTIREAVGEPEPKPSQVRRLNEVARQRAPREDGADPRTIATERERTEAALAAIERGESPRDAIAALGYTSASAQQHLATLRKKGLVPRRDTAQPDVPRPGFDLDAATKAIEGAA